MRPDANSKPLAGALVVLLSILCYADATEGPFLFDDFASIVSNPHVERLVPLGYALDAPEGSGADGRPLVALSLALDYAVGGKDPSVFRLTNIVLHALTALVLFGLVRRTVMARVGPGDRHGALPTLVATGLAAIWAAHPIHVATLHHVIQRNGILVALFYLGTLYAAARGMAGPRRGPWFVLSVASCMLGAGCKEVIVTAPLVVLLYDRALVSGSFSRALARHRALYLGLAGSWLVLAAIMSTGNRSATAGFGVEDCPPIDYLRTQTTALLLYLRRTLWPVGHVFDYGNYAIARSWGDVAVETTIVLLLLGSALLGLARNRVWGFVATSSFLILSPTSSFVPLSGAVVAEHRMYLASAGVLVLVGMAVGRGLKSVSVSPRIRTGVATALCLTVLGGLFALTWQRNRVFSTGLGVWEDTVRKRPDNARAWSYYASMLRREGRDQEAEQAYREAIGAKSSFYMPHINLGNLLAERGDLVGAEEVFARAVELQPRLSRPQYSLGVVRLQLGNEAEGVASLRRALASGLEPKLRREARRLLAWSLATSRDGSVRDPEEALRLAQLLTGKGAPRPQRLDVLAAALAALGRFDEAVAVLDQALELPDSVPAPLRAGLRTRRAQYARGEPWRE